MIDSIMRARDGCLPGVRWDTTTIHVLSLRLGRTFSHAALLIAVHTKEGLFCLESGVLTSEDCRNIRMEIAAVPSTRLAWASTH